MKNPLLKNTEIVDLFNKLDPGAKKALKDFCNWLYLYARNEAENAWARSKAPMAVYWKAVAAWSYHIKRVIK